MFLFLPYGLWNSQPSTNLNKAGKNTQLNNQIDLKYFGSFCAVVQAAMKVTTY